ncbi:MAG TPA: energy transducer TonB [Acidobacteriota bacterium]|nr:energy transducer TonB [Acidobacteriota bacterium]
MTLTTIVIAFEISSVRSASNRLLAAMRGELSQYRMVLLVPRLAAPAPPAKQKMVRTRRIEAPRPLAVPNPRLLRRLEPSLAEFVNDNPEIESILTREIVRDVDNKVLDVHRLLDRSSIRVSFEINEAGQISGRKIDKSSGVASIDHLALELIKLLDKYQMLRVTKGVEKVFLLIDIDRTVEVSLEEQVAESAELDVVRRQAQNMLAMVRFALVKEAAAILLNDISITTGDNRVIISKSFEKEALTDFLIRYCLADQQK